MTALVRFLAMPSADKGELMRAAATLWMVRAALHFVSIERLRIWAGRPGKGQWDAPSIVWAVRTAARWSAGTTCLASALCLQRLLAANGHASELHIGVARGASSLAAHAWVTSDGEVLLGEHERDAYVRLVAWRTAQPPA